MLSHVRVNSAHKRADRNLSDHNADSEPTSWLPTSLSMLSASHQREMRKSPSLYHLWCDAVGGSNPGLAPASRADAVTTRLRAGGGSLLGCGDFWWFKRIFWRCEFPLVGLYPYLIPSIAILAQNITHGDKVCPSPLLHWAPKAQKRNGALNGKLDGLILKIVLLLAFTFERTETVVKQLAGEALFYYQDTRGTLWQYQLQTHGNVIHTIPATIFQ